MSLSRAGNASGRRVPPSLRGQASPGLCSEGLSGTKSGAAGSQMSSKCHGGSHQSDEEVTVKTRSEGPTWSWESNRETLNGTQHLAGASLELRRAEQRPPNPSHPRSSPRTPASPGPKRRVLRCAGGRCLCRDPLA